MNVPKDLLSLTEATRLLPPKTWMSTLPMVGMKNVVRGLPIPGKLLLKA